ncbi:MAG: hypothetical protein RBU29_03370 [bacterium]|jgi:hypothetical protein|nr:hypothetical protein [bacterium]
MEENLYLHPMETATAPETETASEDNWLQAPGVIAFFSLIIIPSVAFVFYIFSILFWKATAFYPIGAVLESFQNLAIYSTSSMSYTNAVFLSLFGYFFYLLGVFFLLYFSIAFPGQRWTKIVLGLFLFGHLFLALSLKDFQHSYKTSYALAETKRGQTLSFEQLKEECGAPAFYRHTPHFSHWAYTDGAMVLPVREGENGQVTVGETPYHLFD